MKNRAKCKLCHSIIESFHETDYVTCKCGEISVDGGLSMRVFANDLNNIMRIDDQGNEVIIKVVDKLSEDVKPLYNQPSRSDLIQMLEEMSKNLDNLPSQALSMTVTHYDLSAFVSLILMIFKAEK